MASVLHLVRATIEAVSPISPASGETGLFDMELVRDANGLPEIAGASLQGVFRQLYSERPRRRPPNELFGFAQDDEGAVSRLAFGFGKVHGADGVAVTGLREADAPDFDGDAILRQLAAEAPLQRDHVALGRRHVAAGRAKFERIAAPRGTRFSFEIAMWGGQDEGKAVLLELLALAAHPAFRLGGAARRGYGRVKLIAAGYAALPSADPYRIRKIRATPPSDRSEFEDVLADLGATDGSAVCIGIRLKPVGLWRVGSSGLALRSGEHELRQGGGDGGRGGPNLRERDVDAASVREPWIDWSSGKGEWREPGRTGDKAVFVIAGSAIKGALAHRTVFHWNRLNRRMIDDSSLSGELEKMAQRSEALEELFGTEKARADDKRRDSGRAARVIVDDALVEIGPENVVAIDHNSIDRFTGGVRSRLLYSEEAVLGGELAMSVTVLPPLNEDGSARPAGSWADGLVEAFTSALRDLCEGRLALGAKSLGFCEIVGQPEFAGDAAGVSQWKEAFGRTRAAGMARGEAA